MTIDDAFLCHEIGNVRVSPEGGVKKSSLTFTSAAHGEPLPEMRCRLPLGFAWRSSRLSISACVNRGVERTLVAGAHRLRASLRYRRFGALPPDSDLKPARLSGAPPAAIEEREAHCRDRLKPHSGGRPHLAGCHVMDEGRKFERPDGVVFAEPPRHWRTHARWPDPSSLRGKAPTRSARPGNTDRIRSPPAPCVLDLGPRSGAVCRRRR